jgi:hypothetical protein
MGIENEDVPPNLAKARSKSLGPVKWCKRCMRKHPARQTCDLYLREREVVGNDGVKRKKRRWAA